MLLLLIVGIFGFGVLLRLLAAMMGPAGPGRVVTRAFWCPFRDRAVTIELASKEWPFGPTEVRSCSAFDPPRTVTCHQRCRDLALPAPAGRR